MEGGKKNLSRPRTEEEEEEIENQEGKEKRKKARRSDRCLSGLELKLDRPLGELDPEKLRNEIRRWARAVARYAHQLSRTVSGRLRSLSSLSSSSKNYDGAAAAPR